MKVGKYYFNFTERVQTDDD